MGKKSHIKKHTKLDHAEDPPYTWDDLGADPSKCPGEGFEWRGNGPPDTGNGNWIKGKRGQLEKLNPDLTHRDPVGPHWDYNSPKYTSGIRIKPDGTWEYKP